MVVKTSDAVKDQVAAQCWRRVRDLTISLSFRDKVWVQVCAEHIFSRSFVGLVWDEIDSPPEIVPPQQEAASTGSENSDVFVQFQRRMT